MDDRRFDWLTRGIAEGRSRRALLKGLLGLGTGIVLAKPAVDDAEAARRGYSGPPIPPKSPTPAPEPPGCSSGSTQCGSACCPDATSECCNGVCCEGYCYNGNQCCPSPREYCAENNTCCGADEKCCINGYCYNPSQGACCQNFECPANGKCCNGTCMDCCSDFDCPSGQICTENNQCCAPTCTPGQCGMDGCGRLCACPAGLTCLGNGTCAKACEAGSVFCTEQYCGSCLVDADASNAYCGGSDRGGACTSTQECPAGQFCTLLDPPSHCVTACQV